MARKLVVEIIGDDRSLQKTYKGTIASTNKFGDSLKRVGKIAGFAAGGAALGGLIIGLKRGVDEFNQTQKVAAQTAAVLKSTGGAAGVSAKHIGKLATELSLMSGVDDEVIQAQENMLLSFTKVRNEAGKGNKIFDRATRVILDYSARTGTDGTTAAKLFGKALNDIAVGNVPKSIRGLGKLSEATQKQIKAYLKAGKVGDAQAVLLKLLENRYKGSAKAAGDTLTGSLNKLSNAFDEFAGNALAPVLTKVAKALSNITTILQGAGSPSEKFQKILEQIGISAETSRRIIADVSETIHTLQVIFTKAFQIMSPILQAWGEQLQAIVQLLDDLIHGRWAKIWGDAVQIVRKTVGLWVTVLTTAIKTLGGVALRIGAAILNGISNGLKGLAQKIISLVVGPINAIIRAINKLPFVHINEIGTGGGGGGKAKPRVTGGGTRGPGTGVPGPSGPISGFMRGAARGASVTASAGLAAGAASVGGVIINGAVTVVANNPDEFMKALQKKARRQAPSRAGRFGGTNLGFV